MIPLSIFLVSILLLPVWFSTRHLVDFPKLPLNSTFARVEYSVTPQLSYQNHCKFRKAPKYPLNICSAFSMKYTEMARRFQTALSHSTLCNSLLSPPYSSAFVYKLDIILIIADAAVLDVANWRVSLVPDFLPTWYRGS